jgi:SAM-dependent methyltransferase
LWENAAAAGVSVEYKLGDLRELPFDGPFDAVLCWFTSFGYFDDENYRVLRELRRVLRPGGRLLIETMHRDVFIRSPVRARTPPRSRQHRRLMGAERLDAPRVVTTTARFAEAIGCEGP